MCRDLTIIFRDSTDDKVLCFMCAVQAVMKGHTVEPEIDEYGQSGNDMRRYSCENSHPDVSEIDVSDHQLRVFGRELGEPS